MRPELADEIAQPDQRGQVRQVQVVEHHECLAVLECFAQACADLLGERGTHGHGCAAVRGAEPVHLPGEGGGNGAEQGVGGRGDAAHDGEAAAHGHADRLDEQARLARALAGFEEQHLAVTGAADRLEAGRNVRYLLFPSPQRAQWRPSVRSDYLVIASII